MVGALPIKISLQVVEKISILYHKTTEIAKICLNLKDNCSTKHSKAIEVMLISSNRLLNLQTKKHNRLLLNASKKE